MIYLDNAATSSPKPLSVIRAVDGALKNLSANPGRGGHTPSVRASQEVYRARRTAAAFFGMEQEENVIFTDNCTTALNTVIHGVLNPGDHVIISSVEHNAVLRPLESLRRSGVITYSIAEVGTTDEQTMEAFRSALNSRTRLIVCTHASNVYGAVLPVGRLCALAHSYGVLFCLDAAQSAGVLPIRVAEDAFDFVCCAGHKGLYGPMGTGLLLVNSPTVLRPLTQGGTGSASADPDMPSYLPDRFESGTRNVPGIVGLRAGIDFVTGKGQENIYRQEMSHIHRIYDALSRADRVRIFSPLSEGRASAPVLSFTIDGADSESVAEYLNQQHGVAVRAGLHCAPLAHRHIGTEETGTVRISPSVFTTDQEVQKVIYAIKKFVQFA